MESFEYFPGSKWHPRTILNHFYTAVYTADTLRLPGPSGPSKPSISTNRQTKSCQNEPNLHIKHRLNLRVLGMVPDLREKNFHFHSLPPKILDKQAQAHTLDSFPELSLVEQADLFLFMMHISISVCMRPAYRIRSDFERAIHQSLVPPPQANRVWRADDSHTHESSAEEPLSQVRTRIKNPLRLFRRFKRQGIPATQRVRVRQRAVLRVDPGTHHLGIRRSRPALWIWKYFVRIEGDRKEHIRQLTRSTDVHISPNP